MWGTPQITDNSAENMFITCSAESESSLDFSDLNGQLPGVCYALDASENYDMCTFSVNERGKKISIMQM